MKHFLSRFYKYMFLGIKELPERIIEVNAVETEKTTKQKKKKSNKNFNKEQAQIKIINIINWLLIVICLVSFLFIIVYLFIYPDKPVPDIIQNAFWSTLGWFGGAFSAFFQIDQNRR